MSKTLILIPLSQLQLSPLNVRKTQSGADIEQLAASIAEIGLLENLVVQQVSAKGKKDRYEVVAGGRRFAALKLLAKRKKIEADHPVASLIVASGAATEASLAENFVRLPLHPADQFEAFAELVVKGQSADDIGARFGVQSTFVLQRLKLASVSPRLVQEYRDGRMTLEQLSAFTITDDRTQQETIWFDRSYADLPPPAIRRLLTSSHVPASDPRAVLIGLAAYEAAGGTVIRDLFDTESEGYLSDSRFLDRLVGAKLEAEAQTVRGEGWQWVEIATNADLAAQACYRGLARPTVPLEPQDQERLEQLGEDYDRLIEELEDEDQSGSAQLDHVLAEMAALQDKKMAWSDEDKARAGAIVALEWNGSVSITRGLVRKADEPQAVEAPPENETETPARRSEYPDGVLLELSAHRTAVLRAVLCTNRMLALRAVVHVIAEQLLYRDPTSSCLSIHGSEVYLHRPGLTVAGSKADMLFQEAHKAWLERLPNQSLFWDWTGTLSLEDLLGLLAHCASLTVNALVGEGTRHDPLPLLKAAEVDMCEWWRPTAERFFGRLTKAHILGAVEEGASPQSAKTLQALKRDEMAAKAEALIAPTRWLPALLRQTAENQQETTNP